MQIACTNTSVRVARAEAMQNPLVCALYAAQKGDFGGDDNQIIQVAKRYAEAGDFARAIAIVESLQERGFIENLEHGGFRFRRLYEWNIAAKIEVYAHVAILQSKVGLTEEANKNLERSLSLARMFEPNAEWTNIGAIGIVASNYILIGQEAKAFSLFHELPAAATVLAGSSQWPKIKMDSSEIELLRRKIEILVMMAESLAKVGKREKSVWTLAQAEELLERNQQSDTLWAEISDLVEAYIQVEATEHALRLIQKFTENKQLQDEKTLSNSAWIKSELATKFVKLGKLPDGIRLAETITTQSTKARAYADMAVVLAQSKDYNNALSMLKRINPEEVKDNLYDYEKIAQLLLDEGNFAQAFELANQLENVNYKANIIAYAAQKYAARGERDNAQESARQAFHFERQSGNDNGFSESAVQYILLVDKSVAQEILKAEATKPGADWALKTIAEMLVKADQDDLAIEILGHVRIDDNDTDAGLLTTQDYRADAISTIALHYYDSKRPVDAKLQATLAEFVKLLD